MLFGKVIGAERQRDGSCGKQESSSSRSWSSERRNLAIRFPFSIISSKIV